MTQLTLMNISITTIAKMNKFDRGIVLAKARKEQKELLATARRAISAGALKCANHYLAKWKRVNKAYKLAVSWQSI